jgi:hypothetical protein
VRKNCTNLESLSQKGRTCKVRGRSQKTHQSPPFPLLGQSHRLTWSGWALAIYGSFFPLAGTSPRWRVAGRRLILIRPSSSLSPDFGRLRGGRYGGWIWKLVGGLLDASIVNLESVGPRPQRSGRARCRQDRGKNSDDGGKHRYASPEG